MLRSYIILIPLMRVIRTYKANLGSRQGVGICGWYTGDRIMLEKKASLSVFGVWESIMKLLCDLVESLGGNFEAIRFLVKAEGRATLEAVAQVIVDGYNAYLSADARALVDACCPDQSAGTGYSVVSRRFYIINCDADPFVPKGWTVESHIRGGQFEWDPSQIELYLDKGQLGDNALEGNRLWRRLVKRFSKRLMNACVLDFLLAHPELIPEEWKSKIIFFWDTVYRHSDDCLYVRCLYWNGDRWYWHYRWLGNDFDGSSPAALRK